MLKKYFFIKTYQYQLYVCVCVHTHTHTHRAEMPFIAWEGSNVHIFQ